MRGCVQADAVVGLRAKQDVYGIVIPGLHPGLRQRAQGDLPQRPLSNPLSQTPLQSPPTRHLLQLASGATLGQTVLK
jgi:hypothetical protein